MTCFYKLFNGNVIEQDQITKWQRCDICKKEEKGLSMYSKSRKHICNICVAKGLDIKSPKQIQIDEIQLFAEDHNLTFEQAKQLLKVKKIKGHSIEFRNKQAKRMSLARQRQEQKRISLAEAFAELKSEGLY